MNEKIAIQLQQMDKLMFDLRMSLTALQSELHQSATFSTKVPIDQYNTALFEASPHSPDIEVTESHVEPDGFHGKSYKDFEKHEEEQWKNALCAEKSLRALARL